jgi:hypothetical protein
MESNNHKGTELNNVKETWDQNERNLQAGGADGSVPEESTPTSNLDKLIKQEASEYDNTNKEDRTLSGDRATVNDDDTSDSTE